MPYMGHMLCPLLLYSLTGKVTSKDLIRLMSAWHGSTGISSCHLSSRWQALFVETQHKDGTVWNNLNKYTFLFFFSFNTSSHAASTPHLPILFNVTAKRPVFCWAWYTVYCWVEVGWSRWLPGDQQGHWSGRLGVDQGAVGIKGCWRVPGRS